MLKPRIGDKVRFHDVVVTRVYTDTFQGVQEGEKSGPYNYAFSRIAEILPREPQVGDTVWWGGPKQTCWTGSTLLYIHFDPEDEMKRKWGVVAYKGDAPTYVKFSDLRLTRECVA